VTSTGRLYIVALLVTVVLLGSSRSAGAYSVLAHEAMVDAVWQDQIVPLLRTRFPATSPEALSKARAFAYGGSVIQDLGYFPFGNKFFSNLVHYVRSGDLVEALIREARDANEYAFALGALAHYASDNNGHPQGTNRAVPLLYPKLRAEFGDAVLFAQSPSRHLMVEFAFDVLQVGGGAFAAQAYRDFIGFEVAKELLDRAVFSTYGFQLKDLFLNVDLALGTYRRSISSTIPEITRLAWEDKQDEIRKRTPGIDRSAFVFTFTREEYERVYGATYQKPGIFSRVLFFLLKLVPKIGPFKPLAFSPLTTEAARLLLDSFEASRDRYRALLQTVSAAGINVANTDFDTGQPPGRGDNPLVEETFAELVEKLTSGESRVTPAALIADITRHYSSPIVESRLTRKQRKMIEKAQRLVPRLNAVASQ
jgi:Zinc dependent phospholipase C